MGRGVAGAGPDTSVRASATFRGRASGTAGTGAGGHEGGDHGG